MRFLKKNLVYLKMFGCQLQTIHSKLFLKRRTISIASDFDINSSIFFGLANIITAKPAWYV